MQASRGGERKRTTTESAGAPALDDNTGHIPDHLERLRRDLPSHVAAILLLGSAWYPSRYPQVIERFPGALPNAAIATFVCSSCRRPVSFCFGQGIG
jgi:hypothetical protein